VRLKGLPSLSIKCQPSFPADCLYDRSDCLNRSRRFWQGAGGITPADHSISLDQMQRLPIALLRTGRPIPTYSLPVCKRLRCQSLTVSHGILRMTPFRNAPYLVVSWWSTLINTISSLHHQLPDVRRACENDIDIGYGRAAWSGVRGRDTLLPLRSVVHPRGQAATHQHGHDHHPHHEPHLPLIRLPWSHFLLMSVGLYFHMVIGPRVRLLELLVQRHCRRNSHGCALSPHFSAFSRSAFSH
jgi:hypothetical protein